MSCDRNELKDSFFNVVNIEEKLHFTSADDKTAER